jgi:hypothetical protein
MDLAIGSTGPGGGKVFYFSSVGFTSTGSACDTSCHYLEARPHNDTKVRWCKWNDKLIVGTFGTAIGTGFSNTKLMSDSTYCATGASTSAKVESGGYSDWFLPSKDELKALKDSPADFGYRSWSSSQGGAAYANSSSADMAKSELNYVHPVRAF